MIMSLCSKINRAGMAVSPMFITFYWLQEFSIIFSIVKLKVLNLASFCISVHKPCASCHTMPVQTMFKSLLQIGFALSKEHLCNSTMFYIK